MYRNILIDVMNAGRAYNICLDLGAIDPLLSILDDRGWIVATYEDNEGRAVNLNLVEYREVLAALLDEVDEILGDDYGQARRLRNYKGQPSHTTDR
jgi:hypothetical protein